VDPSNPGVDTVSFGLRIVFHDGCQPIKGITPRLFLAPVLKCSPARHFTSRNGKNRTLRNLNGSERSKFAALHTAFSRMFRSPVSPGKKSSMSSRAKRQMRTVCRSFVERNQNSRDLVPFVRLERLTSLLASGFAFSSGSPWLK
jgi:hypothetical protein